jgi:hypothetical protein
VNQNFSHFTKECVSAVLQSTVGTGVEFEAMSPNSVTFNFGSTIANSGRANCNGNNEIQGSRSNKQVKLDHANYQSPVAAQAESLSSEVVRFARSLACSGWSGGWVVGYANVRVDRPIGCRLEDRDVTGASLGQLEYTSLE